MEPETRMQYGQGAVAPFRAGEGSPRRWGGTGDEGIAEDCGRGAVKPSGFKRFVSGVGHVFLRFISRFAVSTAGSGRVTAGEVGPYRNLVEIQPARFAAWGSVRV